MIRIFWTLGGGIALLLAIAGTVLPLVPTVPFLLLAAFCFARSSQTLHHWLLDHPHLGPPIRQWRDRGAIGRKAKVLASVSIAVAFAGSIWLGIAPWLLALQGVVLAGVAMFIWTRPEA